MADRVILAITLALAGAYFYATQQVRVLSFGDPVGPRAYPQLLCAALLVVAGLLLFEMRAARRSAAVDTGEPTATDPRHLVVVAGVTVVTALYFALFAPLGYAIATTLYLLTLTSYFRRGRWMTNAAVAVGFGFGSYVLFVRVLGADLPTGPTPF